MHTDIKIGPVYEKKYDEPARDIAPIVEFKSYAPINLTKGFLFGNPDIQSELKKEIEEFGILPYKINSKKLGKYRLDPINDTLSRTSELIYRTVDPRTLVDLLSITELARRRLTKENRGKREIMSSNIEYLRKNAFEDYMKYIYDPLH